MQLARHIALGDRLPVKRHEGELEVALPKCTRGSHRNWPSRSARVRRRTSTPAKMRRHFVVSMRANIHDDTPPDPPQDKGVARPLASSCALHADFRISISELTSKQLQRGGHSSVRQIE